jgi:hypothetical protein
MQEATMPDHPVAPVEQSDAAEPLPGSGALAVLEREGAPAAMVPHVAAMGDADIQRAYRKATALAQSNIYKDLRTAEQAFAKLMIGHALGLNEAQALTLYVVEGKVEIPYPLMGVMVRARPGYSYRAAFIRSESGKAYGPDERVPDGDRELVYLADEDPLDTRPVVGAAIEFTVHGERVGVSVWTIEDSIRADLTRDRGSAKSNHVKYPRNLFLGRAMANGVKWTIPEVAAGLPVYSPGEVPEGETIGAAPADGDVGWGDLPVDWAHEVERRVRRAEQLGHRGLSSLAAAQMTLRSAAQPQVEAWLARADAELDRVKAAAETGADDLVTDAKVVGDGESMPEVTVEEANAEVAAMREDAAEADEPIGLTAEELAAEITKAEARVSAAQSEGEHAAASADLARLRAAQGQLRIDG